jgi:hypothetical protein
MLACSSPSGPRDFRSSQRLTITIPYATLQALVERSNHEGRSLRNLAAYLLESSLDRRGSGCPSNRADCSAMLVHPA